ncbi:MAG TPA: CBS domain-containing protein [Solirubrobacterales bacterium]|nr:CBS domain-containing protein [Solirubrobacterales bacterium]
MTTVGECMSTDISPVRPDTSLVEAAQRMRITGVGGIPVFGHEGRECAGILTERDIVIRVLAEERDARAVVVRDVATLNPVTCAPEEDVAEVAERMREHCVQHLPVCRAGEVVGMLSLADVVFGRPDEERGTIEPPRSVSR